MPVPWNLIFSMASTIGSGVMSAVNNRKMQSAEAAETARQLGEGNLRANEDYVGRSENAYALGTLDRKLNNLQERSAGKQKVIGGTPEMTVAQQKANANAYADAVSGIAAKASANRDKALDAIEKVNHQHAENQMTFMENRNKTYENLFSNAASAFSDFAEGWEPGERTPREKKPKKEE